MNRGEIWRINLDPTVGAEIQKTRPVIIINDDNLGILPLRVIIPLTDWKDRYAVAPWMVQVHRDDTNNLSKDSSADCFQVRSVSINRFVKKIGEVDGFVIAKIEIALVKVLKIDS